MLLITSAAYIDGELASEFGNIPPSFLPIGNKRLYEHQVKLARESGVCEIFISLPADYELDSEDINFFNSNNISIIKVPTNLTLGESIAFCWSYFEGSFVELNILHGDTFFLDIDLKKDDLIYIAKNEGYYKRAVIENYEGNISIISKLSSENDLILAGYFSFSNGFKLVKELHSTKFDLLRSIENYNKIKKLNFLIGEKWLDFGHVTSYYRSRASMTTQRVFNGLSIDNNTVLKYSNNKNKMLGEYSWFNNLPSKLKVYCPKSLWYKEMDDYSEYAIEYIYASSLSDIFVFGRHDSSTWKEIISQIRQFILNAKIYSEGKKIDSSKFDELYLNKTMTRLIDYSNQTGFDISKNISLNNKTFPSLVDIARLTSTYISTAVDDDITIVHGDLCFSNILYNFRSQSIKLIDPRGIDNEGNVTIFGDQRYELAKFAHSIIGLYDYIISGRYSLSINDEYSFDYAINYPAHLINLQSMFFDVLLDNDPVLFKEVMAITVHLFLSMLPLHSDDPVRQTALMLNGIMLYEKYFGERGDIS